ncbi:hypothetical protein JB92DRAFT_2749944 [Gautieria morchelliformis]|nr:hypothetical protein JB92DRAFT_2749944 [Gautieria morchelliformis]
MRSLLRLPFRQSVRLLHSPAARPRPTPERAALGFGVSIAVAGYVGWRIAGSNQHIALDALPKGEISSIDDRHSNGEMGPGYPSGSNPKAAAQDDDTERSPPKNSSAEEEEEGQSAFNPATGEINWDCPCLGGMAHGPCGQQFREAFSCFVFSEQEPKGVDCIEKFKNMQDCFREHPDVYGEEIADDEDDSVPDPSAGGPKPADSPAVQPASEFSRDPVNKANVVMSREKQ